MDVSPKYVPITNAEAEDDEKLFERIAAQIDPSFTPLNCDVLPFEHVELRVYKPQPAARVVVIRPPKNEPDFTSARVYPQEEEKQQQSQSPPKRPPVLESGYLCGKRY